MTGLLDGILGLLGTILYPLFSFIFLLIDLLQSLFKAFAGTGTVYYGGSDNWAAWGGDPITGASDGGEKSTGLLYYLMNQPIIKNIFWSMLYLAIILLVVFTAMAFLKNLYAPQPKKWQDILGNAIKGIGNFIFIPVCCLLGVWLANIGLQAVEGATSSSGNTTAMSRQLFICCSYNANKIRRGEFTGMIDGKMTFESVEELKSMASGTGITVESRGLTSNKSEPRADSDGYYAQILDDIYASEKYGIYEQVSVGYGYNLIYINYIILIAGGVFMMYVLGAITFAMIKRLFYLLMLYVISPIACAMYPLNEGSTVGTWRSEFLKHTISAYGAVAGMNLFFSLSPIIQNIRIPELGGFGALGIVTLILTIAGLYVVKDFISFISSLIGADNAYSSGAGLMNSVKGRMKQGMEKTNKMAQGTAGAFGKAASAAKIARAGGDSGAGAFFGSLGKSAGTGMLNAGNSLAKMGGLGLDIKGISDSASKGYNKEGTDKAAAVNDVIARMTTGNNSGLTGKWDGELHTADGETVGGASRKGKRLRKKLKSEAKRS